MFEVSDRVGVSLWTQEVWNLLGIIIGGEITHSKILVNHNCAVLGSSIHTTESWNLLGARPAEMLCLKGIWAAQIWVLLWIQNSHIRLAVSFLESNFMHSCLFIHVTAVVLSEKVMYFVIRPPTLYASNTIMNSLAWFTGISVCGTNNICCWFHEQLCSHDMIMPPLYFTDNNYLIFISNLPSQVFNASIFCC